MEENEYRNFISHNYTFRFHSCNFITLNNQVMYTSPQKKKKKFGNKKNNKNEELISHNWDLISLVSYNVIIA